MELFHPPSNWLGFGSGANLVVIKFGNSPSSLVLVLGWSHSNASDNSTCRMVDLYCIRPGSSFFISPIHPKLGKTSSDAMRIFVFEEVLLNKILHQQQQQQQDARAVHTIFLLAIEPWKKNALLSIIRVYYNPHIAGQYHPLYTLNNQVFFCHCSILYRTWKRWMACCHSPEVSHALIAALQAILSSGWPAGIHDA